MPAGEPFEFGAPDGARLRGTLTLPASRGEAPAALLLNGSGPLDRDSNMPRQALDVANVLASALAERGVASLRYDKRGVAESDGDYLSTGFEQETADALAALEALRASLGVAAHRVAVVGHSVGATIAIRLASRDSDLVGVVLLAGASVPGAEVMRIQSDRIAASMRGPLRILAGRIRRRQARVRQKLLASTGDVTSIGRQRLPARWFREYMAYDPAPDLRAIRCPVLAITGADDLQVEPEDVERMRRLVSSPFDGRTPARLTHVLRTYDGRPSLASYRKQLERPIDGALVEQVVAWIAERGCRGTAE